MLAKLPKGFITKASINPDTAFWLQHLVLKGACRSILEVGSGVSTVVLASAIDTKVQFVSLEESFHWHRQTRIGLSALELTHKVRLLHAPLTRGELAGVEYRVHNSDALPEMSADLLLVDAPPSQIGRVGVLPRFAKYLRPGCLIVLDDAVRWGEEECVRLWVQCGLAVLRGYLPLGRGLALLVTKQQRFRIHD